jgi:hypothetical protein
VPSTLTVVIEGVDMPGRSCGPAGGPCSYDNIHVGVQRKQEVIDLVPGDAAGASWTFDVTAKEVDTDVDPSGLDFSGPFVHGRRGDRFIYLSWGVVDDEGFHMFRRAKLRFTDADPKVLRAAVRSGTLRWRMGMTDAKGNPRCARVEDATLTAG